MALRAICSAAEYCGKKDTCYHGKEHEFKECQGCTNSVVCLRLAEAKKENTALAADMPTLVPECIILE